MNTSIGDLNPFPTDAAADRFVDAERQARDLGLILQQPVPKRSTPPRRSARAGRAVLAAAIFGILGVAGYTGFGGSVPAAQAATPPVLPRFLSAGTSSPNAALVVARDTQISTQPGQLGSRYQQWSLFTRVEREGRSSSGIVPQEVVYRVAPDRSGHLQVTPGQPADGVLAGVTPTGAPIRDESYGPNSAPLSFPSHLSSDDADLFTQLKVGHPIDELGSGELFVAVADLYSEQRPEAAVRAAVIRVVTHRPDVRTLGSVTDRAGRAGLGLAVTSSQPGGLPSRFVLVFDETSGDLLSFEQILTSSPGKLDVKIPAVIDYKLFKYEAN